MDHARAIIKHPARPLVRRIAPWTRLPVGELALEETLEEEPLLDAAENCLVEERIEKPFPCVTMLDCSFSMAGEKHLLSSVAVAVLLLEVPARDTALIVFGSEARALKRLGAETKAEETLLDFLRLRPGGFTNLGAGLEAGLKELRASRGRRVGILATDGRATEGPDPFQIARRFDYLVVLHLHGPGSHPDASRQLASAGNGVCLEVEKMADLPRRLYDAVRTIARR